ncbi:PIN domain-containing protein [Moraxella nasicaprae]|uniref:PIN domain-containing protein n=1 Tax=Moraxella nasicaprae TaxID=2904122 RepID=A0ABY6F605_9GAMM|nr:PIN domain-containing protein [Moraxella nasicaprae]UXZ05541.1 PIN domain-containing protein [Moraxella nasicaprae]
MLDTNIVIHIIKQKPAKLLGKFNQYAGRICISAITASELWAGVYHSQRVYENGKILADFLSRIDVLPYKPDCCQYYGENYAQLAKDGRLISENDLHIASHAKSLGLILVTNNTKEFARVQGLELQDWLE